MVPLKPPGVPIHLQAGGPKRWNAHSRLSFGVRLKTRLPISTGSLTTKPKRFRSTEDATMVEISIAIVRRDRAAEALLHHMAEHLCGDGESRLPGTPETHEIAAR